MSPFNTINNLRQNREKTTQEKTSRLLTTLKGQKDLRLRAWIHIHTAALLHLNKECLERSVFTKKWNWQVTLKWPDKILKGDYQSKTHYELQFSTGLTCKHDKCLIPWKRKEKEKKSNFLGNTVDMTCQRKAVLLFAWVIITIQHAFSQELIAMWRN